MKYLFFFLLSIPLFVSAQELKVIRLEYPTATIDMHTTDVLSKSLKDISEDDDPTLVAYKGAIFTLRAKFARPIKDKKSYFKKGVALLEYAISVAPDNIEIRCIRLGVQENAPRIVRYKSNIKEDKQFLLDHYPSTKNQDIKDFISSFVQQSKAFSDTEKQLF